MQTVPDPATLFTDCARRMAFALRLQDAERKGTGVVLELNRSQFARDGLVAASSSFALTVRRSKLTPDEAARLATCLASRAPTDVWWRPVYTATRPETLDRADAWHSLEELRVIAAAIDLLLSEPAYTETG
jgi:hypothetical protein